MQKIKTQKGITLVALIITIIVMLILVAVTLVITLGENGIIQKAKEASLKSNDRQNAEKDEFSSENAEKRINDLVNEGKSWDIFTGKKIPTEEEEVKKESGNDKGYVGYYADVDGDDEVDGVIYADLAVGVSGQWTNNWGDYSYEKVTNLKEYTISKENYDGAFGTKPVIKAVSSTGNDRFYVMALNDVALDGSSTADPNSVYWNWYNGSFYFNPDNPMDYSARRSLLDPSMSIPPTREGSDDFGQGQAKTKTMITKWNEEAYGEKDTGNTIKDLWGIFKHESNKAGTVDSNKWFIPSKGEWSAFGGNLGINKENYVALGLSESNWASSQGGSGISCGRFQGYLRVWWVHQRLQHEHGTHFERVYGCSLKHDFLIL